MIHPSFSIELVELSTWGEDSLSQSYGNLAGRWCPNG
jgi:hypothetical protein